MSFWDKIVVVTEWWAAVLVVFIVFSIMTFAGLVFVVKVGKRLRNKREEQTCMTSSSGKENRTEK